MREHVIRIINDTSEKSPVKAVTGNEKSAGGETSEDEATKGEKVLNSLVKRVVSVGAIVHTADQILSHQHSTISLQTGAQEYGQRASYIYQKAGGFVKTVAMGALAGGLPGAVVAGVLNVGSNAVSYLFKQDILQKEKELEDISRRMRMMRATVSGRRYSNITEF